MNQIEKILLQAIQKSLWNTDIIFPDDTDWNAVLKEAEVQAVLGIVIGVAPPEVQKAWQGRASVGMAHFVRILHYQEQLYKLLKDNDIPMVVLKGTAAAIYYSNPAQRSMGDIDFLVPPEHFDRAKELLIQNGYSIEDDPRAPRHMHVYKDGISFEQHRYFSSEGIDVEEYVTEGIQQIEIRTICGVEFPMLPKLANGLVLLGHVAHHLEAGLGLRQIIDWMMYVNRELSDDNWNDSFGTAAKDVGLDAIATVTTKMCQKYLGLSDETRWCNIEDTKLCDELMESLLLSGNFGRKMGDGNKIWNVTSSFRKNGLFRTLQETGEKTWKAYRKHKWLKPFAWIYQACRFIRRGIHSKQSKSEMLTGIEQSRERKELYRILMGQEKG